MIEDHVALRRAGHVTSADHRPVGAHVAGGVWPPARARARVAARAPARRPPPAARRARAAVRLGGEARGARWSWPPPEARTLRLHLQPGGALAADPPPPDGEPDRYRYDPAHPTPGDRRAVLLARQPVTRQPPARGARRRHHLHVRAAGADARGHRPGERRDPLPLEPGDTDVFVRVCDVLPDGVSLNVCDGAPAASPGAPGPEPDGVRSVALDLWPTAHRFRAGHRIRVQVSSGAHPRYARNPGTGRPRPPRDTLVAADQEVFHDAGHPSAVMLSVMPQDAQPPASRPPRRPRPGRRRRVRPRPGRRRRRRRGPRRSPPSCTTTPASSAGCSCVRSPSSCSSPPSSWPGRSPGSGSRGCAPCSAP